MRRKKGFCGMCRPFELVYKMSGRKVPTWDPLCSFCGGYGVIPYKWRKGDRDRRIKDRRKS